jgi:hypothetical protein
MTSDEPITKERAERKSVAEELSSLVRDDAPVILGWACLIAASLVIFSLGKGTPYHQLAAGILMSSSTLFVLMALFELFWRLLVDRNS